MRILIVEDDENLVAVLRRGLLEQHYTVDTALDGIEGEELALRHEYDLILLDRMLPRKDGLGVIRELRQQGVDTPILMLTALGAAEDMIAGLDAGADDYLPKPFHFGVLLARIRSLSRRGSDQKRAEMQVADLVLDTSRRSVKRGETSINLSAKEFALLEYMMMNAGRVLTREMIGEHVWEMHFDHRSNVIDAFIRLLRRKIDHGFARPLIHTVRGVGYRFSEDP
jgi:DNA-binding response OmpR family regulator